MISRSRIWGLPKTCSRPCPGRRTSSCIWARYDLFETTTTCLPSTNLESTKVLVELAALKRIPIHFVSTSGVLPRDALGSARVYGVAGSADAFIFPVDGSTGYVASKWASERLLERSAAAPPPIYRLLPPAHAAQANLSKTKVLEEFVRCIDLAGVTPDYTGWECQIYLASGRQVAQWPLESIIASPSSTGEAETAVCRFSHLQSSVSLEASELKAYIEEHWGQRGLGRRPALKWMGWIKAAGLAVVLTSMKMTVKDNYARASLGSRRGVMSSLVLPKKICLL